MPKIRARQLLAPLVLLAVVSACSGPVTPAQTPSGSAGVVAQASAPATTEPTASAQPSATPTDEPTEQPTATERPSPTLEPSATPTASITDVLGVEWTTDSDGNAIPDAVEVAIGSDPLVEECPTTDCGDVPAGSEFNATLNVMVLFDSSGSMAGVVGGERKIDIAKRAVEQYLRVGSIAADVGLLVYGHTGNNTDAGKAESCAGPEILAPLGQADDATATNLIGRFEPTGWTPIGGALEKAQEAFAGKDGQINRIVVVSDGIETCEGDPVGVAARLHNEGIKATVDVIGFDLQEAGAAEQMRLIAENGGGQFYDARTREEFQQYLREQLGKIAEGRKAATCAYDNLHQFSLCRNAQYTDAVRYVDELRNTQPDRAMYDVYSEVIERITATWSESIDASVEAARLSEEAQRKVQELERAIREATAP